MTAALITTPASRLRRARQLLIGRSARKGVARSSWVVALLIGLFWLL